MIKFIEDKELCIKLKEKGFDEGCILQFRGEDTQPICQMGYELNYEKNSDYNNDDNYWLVIPTYCQVSDWLREKHNILLGYGYSPNYNKKFACTLNFIEPENYRQGRVYTGETYYEALNKAIEESLELI